MGWDSYLFSINKAENAFSTDDWESLIQRAQQMAFFNNIEIYSSDSAINFLIDKRNFGDDISGYALGNCVRLYEESGWSNDMLINLEEKDLPHLAKNEKYAADPNRNYFYNGYHPQSVKYLTDKAIDLIADKIVIPENERTIISLFQISAFYGFAIEEGLSVSQDIM